MPSVTKRYLLFARTVCDPDPTGEVTAFPQPHPPYHSLDLWALGFRPSLLRSSHQSENVPYGLSNLEITWLFWRPGTTTDSESEIYHVS